MIVLAIRVPVMLSFMQKAHWLYGVPYSTVVRNNVCARTVGREVKENDGGGEFKYYIFDIL
jgi:hypothetical protein